MLAPLDHHWTGSSSGPARAFPGLFGYCSESLEPLLQIKQHSGGPEQKKQQRGGVSPSRKENLKTLTRDNNLDVIISNQVTINSAVCEPTVGFAAGGELHAHRCHLSHRKHTHTHTLG